jgi:protein-S-isoprenylcysteine O-methyltransferase Ste14
MAQGADETVSFRLWPPVAIGVPLLAGWLATTLWGDPVDLGGWRVALLVPTFWGLVLSPLAVVLVLWGAIRPEKRFLHERFGATYDDYAQRVRRWL